jgi:hypothetical protein
MDTSEIVGGVAIGVFVVAVSIEIMLLVKFWKLLKENKWKT